MIAHEQQQESMRLKIPRLPVRKIEAFTIAFNYAPKQRNLRLRLPPLRVKWVAQLDHQTTPFLQSGPYANGDDPSLAGVIWNWRAARSVMSVI